MEAAGNAIVKKACSKEMTKVRPWPPAALYRGISSPSYLDAMHRHRAWPYKNQTLSHRRRIEHKIARFRWMSVRVNSNRCRIVRPPIQRLQGGQKAPASLSSSLQWVKRTNMEGCAAGERGWESR